jgi:hypothetical protein
MAIRIMSELGSEVGANFSPIERTAVKKLDRCGVIPGNGK